MTQRLVLGLVALGAVLLAARPADACGGFFCSQVPVTQAGEHLLFSVDQDSSGNPVITAEIQIQYTGSAADFAWVLPLPAVPELSVGSNAVFQTLRQMTEPYHYLQWQNDVGECSGWGGMRGYMDDDDFDAAGAPGAEADGDADGPPSVQIVAQQEVGPYDTVVIRSTDGNSAALLQWLEDNHYDIPDNALPAIQSYVNANHVFVGLKLANDKDAGDIQPIVARFREDRPCIPLLLTAIAANPDMPVYAWVLGPSGIVSVDDYLEIMINPAAIDWFRASWMGQSNYLAVATKAFDEAGGKGFIREFAGNTQFLQNAFYRDGQYNLDRLRGMDDPAAFVQELLMQGFPRDSTMQNLLRSYIPMPQELVDQGVTEQQFYNDLSAYADALADFDFDPEAFVAALDQVIVKPLRDVQGLVDTHPYVTRLFTTISPEEMTLDPLFRFKRDVPDVSNAHTAQAQYLCPDGEDYEHAAIRLVTEDGTVRIFKPGDADYPNTQNYGWVDDDGDGVNDNVGSAPTNMPSLLRAIRHVDDEDSPGQPVIDNSGLIRDSIHSPRIGGGGCSTTGTGSLGGAWLLALAALVVRRIRRN